MADKISHQTIVEKLTARFGSAVLATSNDPKTAMTVVEVDSKHIVSIMEFLHDDMQFQFLTSMFGIHYPEQKGRELGVIYLLHNLYANTRLQIRLYVPVAKPEVDTITKVFSGANWMERETFDFYGVKFKAHPNLKRILNAETMDYHPMRKEYPLEDATRNDKDDSMFGR